jgi:putative membrane protein
MSAVLISYLHYLGFATLASALALELVLFRTEVSGTVARRLARIDAMYGASALVVLGSGLMRLLIYGKPVSYYMQNGLFHVKITLFVLAVLLSVYPTINFIKNRNTPDDGQAVYSGAVGVLLKIQLLILLIIPLLAVMMARGYGFKG